MIFSVAEIIAYVSQVITLEPGDVLVIAHIDDSGDRTLAGKARGVRHRPAVSGGAIGQVGQVSVRPVPATGCAQFLDVTAGPAHMDQSGHGLLTDKAGDQAP